MILTTDISQIKEIYCTIKGIYQIGMNKTKETSSRKTPGQTGN